MIRAPIALALLLSGGIASGQAPPPLSIATALPQQVVVPAGQPGKLIPLRLAGGRAPIQISIVAGTFNGLFAPVRQSRTGRSAPGPIPSVVDTLEAAEQLVGIRYRGSSNGQPPAPQIPVTFRATDASGASVTTAMTVFPVTPQLEIASSNFSGRVASQALTIRTSLLGVPPGMRVTPVVNNEVVSSLSVGETNCYFFTNDAQPAVSNSLGQVSNEIQGTFGVRGGTSTTGPCTIVMAYAVRPASDPVAGSHTFVLKKTGIGLTTPVTVKIENTKSLKEMFGFAPATVTENQFGGNFGTCSGNSLGIASVPVGIVEVGGDLAFRIRSGPIGTGCEWASRRVELRSGTQLRSIRWTVEKVGSKCCVGAAAQCEPENRPGVLQGSLAVIKDPKWGAFDGLSNDGGGRLLAWLQGTGGGSRPFHEWGIAHFEPLLARLRCDGTAVNDHEITLRLESLEMTVPPGTQFPP